MPRLKREQELHAWESMRVDMHDITAPADIDIAQILNLSNFFEWNVDFIFIYKHREPEKY
jgi:hypothetical protein